MVIGTVEPHNAGGEVVGFYARLACSVRTEAYLHTAYSQVGNVAKAHAHPDIIVCHGRKHQFHIFCDCWLLVLYPGRKHGRKHGGRGSEDGSTERSTEGGGVRVRGLMFI